VKLSYPLSTVALALVLGATHASQVPAADQNEALHLHLVAAFEGDASSRQRATRQLAEAPASSHPDRAVLVAVHGLLGGEDPEEACRELVRAAEDGSALAFEWLGLLERRAGGRLDGSAGNGWLALASEAGRESAWSQLTAAAESGEPGARSTCARLRVEGREQVRDEERGWAELEQLALEGHGPSALFVALRDLPWDYPSVTTEKARTLLLAAEAGDLDARAILAAVHAAGADLPGGEGALARLEAAADAGSVRASLELARCYARGWGVVPDCAEVLRKLTNFDRSSDARARARGVRALPGRSGLLKELVELGRAGDSAAAVPLALFVNLGFIDPIEVDAGAAADPRGIVSAVVLDLLEDAIEQGSAQAARLLGELYLFGKLVAQSDQRASELLRQAADGGDTTALRWLGSMALDGRIPGTEPSDGATILREAAERGDPAALYTYASILTNAYGVEQDMQEACEYYRRSKLAGNHNSAIELDRLAGSGIAPAIFAQAQLAVALARHPADVTRGFRLAREALAAASGEPDLRLGIRAWLVEQSSENPGAGFELYLAHRDDSLGMEDPHQAATWLRQAASAGNPESLAVMCDLTRIGWTAGAEVLVAPDLASSLEYGQRACETGFAPAFGILARTLIESEDYEQSFVRARRGAMLGDGTAMWILATLYREGLGVEADAGESIAWGTLALEVEDLEEREDRQRALSVARQSIERTRLPEVGARAAELRASLELGNLEEHAAAWPAPARGHELLRVGDPELRPEAASWVRIEWSGIDAEGGEVSGTDGLPDFLVRVSDLPEPLGEQLLQMGVREKRRIWLEGTAQLRSLGWPETGKAILDIELVDFYPDALLAADHSTTRWGER